jgi:enterochelin esterase-like enzyme
LNGKKSFMLLMIAIVLLAGCSSGQVKRTTIAADSGLSEAAAAAASASSITQYLVVDSTALGKQMKVNVYVPKGYSKERRFPVLYALHGKNGDENTFFSNGLNVNKRADKLIQSGEIEPLIIVAPEFDNSYGINSSSVLAEKNEYGLGMYEDYLIKDLIPIIDANYSTIAGSEGRYIGGISMGGYAAFHLAFTYPDLFSKVGGHSAAVWKDTPDYLSWMYEGGQAQSEVDPVMLASTTDLSGLSIYLDHGDKDHKHIIEGNIALLEQLDKVKATYENHISSGGHNNKYWSSQMDNYLRFYAGNNKSGQ